MMVARKSGLVVNVSSIGGLNYWVNAGKNFFYNSTEPTKPDNVIIDCSLWNW